MTDPTYYRPAIPLLISLICGIVLGSEYPEFKIGLGTAVTLSAACVWWYIYRRQHGAILPILLFVTLGYLSITPWVQPRFPSNHIIHHAGSALWDITGKIYNQPQYFNNRIRFIVQVSSLADDHQTHMVTGKLRVTVVGKLPTLVAGDELRLTSRIRIINNFKNPGGFDYQRYMAFKGVRTTAYVRGDRLVVTQPHAASDPLEYLNTARAAFSDLIDSYGELKSQAVLKALIIGDRTQISPELRQSFNRAGVGHLLAISGLHIGIVATVAFVFFQALAVRVSLLLWRAETRKIAALLSLPPVIIYGVIAGFSPSTQRAVLMVAVFLLTFLFGKEQDSLNTLSLAALLILVVDPPSLFSISFQLSFAAVFAIIYGLSRVHAQGVKQKPQMQESWLLRIKSKIISFFLVSFFAICGSLPLVAYYFNQVSLVGLAANFIVVPLIGFVSVPLGLLALLLQPASTTLTSWCIQASMFVLSYALKAINFFADLPFAAVKIVTPSPLEILCFYILGWALLNLRRVEANAAVSPPAASGAADRRDPAHDHLSGLIGPAGSRRRLKPPAFLQANGWWPQKMAKIAVLLVSLTFTLDTCYWLYQRFWHTDLRVTVIDVGHGSASLLELPGGCTILVDGGGFTDNSTFDVGERIIAPLLWRKKIRTVDTLILSHPNSDHLNGLIYIARYFNVKNVWTNNESRNTVGYLQFMKVIERENIRLPPFRDMPRQYCIDGVELKLLYPPPNYLNLRQIQKWRNTNNNSLVVKASLNSISFLFPGDIMHEAENELVRLNGTDLSSTVLIAPHHGSKTSSTIEFLNAVNPEMVIISSGQNNRFKLPHRTTLERYKIQGYAILRTDTNGMVRLSTNGQHLEVESFAE